MSQRPRKLLKNTLARCVPRTNTLEHVRLQLSAREALVPLAGMGLIIGILAGGVTILFRLAMEWPTTFFYRCHRIMNPSRPFGGLSCRYWALW